MTSDIVLKSDMVLKVSMSVVSIVVFVIGVYVIPMLKAGKYQKEYEVFIDFVAEMVNSANQLFSHEDWKAKKEYVLKLVTTYMNEKTSLGFTVDQIDAFIEGVVREVKAMEGRI